MHTFTNIKPYLLKRVYCLKCKGFHILSRVCIFVWGCRFVGSLILFRFKIFRCSLRVCIRV